MKLLAFLFFLSFLSSSFVLAVPATTTTSNDTTQTQTQTQCTSKSKRQEWRTLTNAQKKDYIDAVKCLHDLPARGDIAAAKTRYDDFQAVHISLTDEIHDVGQFLPWHRYFMTVYETILRNECGFKGSQPYWDWTIDVDNGSFAESPVFDPIHGFGGNGLPIPGYSGQFSNETLIPVWQPGTGGGCVTTGPFASYNLSLGPGTLVTNHCLQRAFNPSMYAYLHSSYVRNTTRQRDFYTFWTTLEGKLGGPVQIHGGGHLGIDGEMGDRYSSPGEPIFYLHHANLDRIWWNWQMTDPKNRLYQVTGRSSPDPPYVNITLDFGLKMRTLADTIPIRDVMDIRRECIEYV